MMFKPKPCEKCEYLVKCEDCPVMVDKRSASKVDDYCGYKMSDFPYLIARASLDRFYCPAHAKMYQKIKEGGYYKLIPAQEVRVNEDGTVYKEKK